MWTPEQRYEAAFRPEREGITIAQAARELGVTTKSYRKWRRSVGIPPRAAGLTCPIGKTYEVHVVPGGHAYAIIETTTEMVTRTESRQLGVLASRDLAQQVADGLTAQHLSA